jgi:hypothetical protein
MKRLYWALIAAVLVMGTVVWLVETSLAAASLGFAVAVAISWCLWLERHPETRIGPATTHEADPSNSPGTR